MRIAILAAALALSAAGGGATDDRPQQVAAQERTAIFAVENMSCALCPITVRKAMAALPGVKSVAVDLAAKTATVLFDPAVVSPAAIAAASADAGYPARPVE